MKLKKPYALLSEFARLTICAILIWFFGGQKVYSQAIIVDEANTSQEVRDLVQDVLLGSCVTVSNVTYTGQPNQAGTFDGSGTILGLDGGILLTQVEQTLPRVRMMTTTLGRIVVLQVMRILPLLQALQPTIDVFLNSILFRKTLRYSSTTFLLLRNTLNG